MNEKKLKDVVLRIRLNLDEQKILEDVKETLNVAQPSKALKICMLGYRNVLHTLFSPKLAKYLFKNDRVKLEDLKNY